MTIAMMGSRLVRPTDSRRTHAFPHFSIDNKRIKIDAEHVSEEQLSRGRDLVASTTTTKLTPTMMMRAGNVDVLISVFVIIV